MSLPAGITWITTKEAADALGCTTGRVRQLRLEGTLTSGRKLGWMTVYDEQEILAHAAIKESTGRPRKYAPRAAS